MTSAKFIDAARREAILARAQLVPKGACHFCGYRLAKGALWCAADCAKEYEKERADLLEPRTLVLGVLKGKDAVPIVSTHRLGAADNGPLQMISANRLQQLLALESRAPVAKD